MNNPGESFIFGLAKTSTPKKNSTPLIKHMTGVLVDEVMSGRRKMENLKRELELKTQTTTQIPTDNLTEIQNLKRNNGILLDEVKSQHRKNEELKRELEEKNEIIKSLKRQIEICK